MTELADELRGRGLIAGDGPLELTAGGRALVGQLVDAGRTELAGLLDDWEQRDADERAPVLRRLAASLVAEIPEDATPVRS